MTSSPPAPQTAGAGDDWGPTMRGGHRGRRRWLVVLVVVALVLPLLYGALLATRLTSSMGRTDVTTLAGSEGGPMQILVTGSDSRADLSEQELLELGTGAVDGDRTDTIFLLTVDGSRAGILAFPRDLWVTRCDGSTGRINAAMMIGGPDCLVTTVQELSGIKLDHYLSVSFGGFRDIVDAVGGVDVCVEKDLRDDFAGVNLAAGCQTLDGVQALGFVRTRKLDNDFERIKRQQQFLGALARKVATPATVLNPTDALPLTGAVGRALTADSGLGLLDLARLANGGRGLAGGAAVTATVPGTGATIGGASVIQVDEAAAAPLFASFRDGSVLQASDPEVTPATTRVQVLNGAGEPGLAGTTRDALVERGYDVVGIGDSDPVDATVIRHPPALKANAELLQRELPVAARLEEVAPGDRITLVLGPDVAEGL